MYPQRPLRLARFFTSGLLITLVLATDVRAERPDGVLLHPMTVSVASKDVNGDGVRDSVKVVCRSGRRFCDGEWEVVKGEQVCVPGWCGGGDIVEGEFWIVVEISGGETAETNLAESMGIEEPLRFRGEKWDLVFADYNGDLQIDFNVGQYGNCNGWVYHIFTIDGSGRTRELPIGKGGGVFVTGSLNSTTALNVARFRPWYWPWARPKSGFEHSYYDRVAGEYKRVPYSWDRRAGKFKRGRERSLKEGESVW